MKKRENQKIAIVVLFIAIFVFMAGPALTDDKNRGRMNDRNEITQLLKDYAWGVDHKDTELWMSIWSEDAVYDLSNLGFGTVEGLEALAGFMHCIVFPGEPMCFSFISNINIEFTGKKNAVGTDYFIHEGYVPVKVDDPSSKYSQFNPYSWDLLEELLAHGADPLLPGEFAFVRDHKEGQHQYEFVKEKGKWKISYLKGLPLFSTANAPVEPIDDIIPIDQRPNAEFFNNWRATVCGSCPMVSCP